MRWTAFHITLCAFALNIIRLTAIRPNVSIGIQRGVSDTKILKRRWKQHEDTHCCITKLSFTILSTILFKFRYRWIFSLLLSINHCYKSDLIECHQSTPPQHARQRYAMLRTALPSYRRTLFWPYKTKIHWSINMKLFTLYYVHGIKKCTKNGRNWSARRRPQIREIYLLFIYYTP